MAIRRVVRPELLDSLDAGDPAAIRSRRDLRLINGLMGNFAWVERQIAPFLANNTRVVEIGAGEGRLLRRLQGNLPGAHWCGIDLAPRPADLPDAIEWVRGDLFQNLMGEVAVGVMITHHFSAKQLAELGRLLQAFRVVCFCEPWRTELSHAWGRLLWPIISPVTKHDMPVSIDAGFIPGELPALLGLGDWNVRESVDWRGSCRLLAWRV